MCICSALLIQKWQSTNCPNTWAPGNQLTYNSPWLKGSISCVDDKANDQFLKLSSTPFGLPVVPDV